MDMIAIFSPLNKYCKVLPDFTTVANGILSAENKMHYYNNNDENRGKGKEFSIVDIGKDYIIARILSNEESSYKGQKSKFALLVKYFAFEGLDIDESLFEIDNFDHTGFKSSLYTEDKIVYLKTELKPEHLLHKWEYEDGIEKIKSMHLDIPDDF